MGIDLEKVCAIIVTYDNRFHFLNEAVNGCIQNGIKKIIIVDNGSEEPSKSKLEELKKLLKDQIVLIRLKENMGSAGGYKEGLSYAYKDPQCEYMWLLDDDNVPANGSLKTLIRFYERLNPKYQDFIALMSYRPSRPYLKEWASINNVDKVLVKNAFLGLHILEFLRAVILRFVKEPMIVKTGAPKLSFGRIPMAPYGGLFLSKSLVKKIGLPNEKFFLYADDFEWTYRITRVGGSIILLFNSIVHDIDDVMAISFKPWFIRYKYVPLSRLYYNARNAVYFQSRYLVNKRLIFLLNMVVFMLLLRIILDENRFKLIKKAIKDGLEGHLGKNFI